MKAVSTALAALLAGRVFTAIDLYIITLADGTVLRYSGGDCSVLDNGIVYPGGGWTGPYFGLVGDNAQCTWALGTGTQTLTISVLPGSSLVEGIPFTQAVEIGLFDGAWMEYRRAYFPMSSTAVFWPLPSTGSVRKFFGRIGDISPAGGTVITFTVNSIAEILQQPWPPEVYQPGCLNVLGDAACAINLASWAITGSALAGSSASAINASLAQPDGWFDVGDIKFTSGVLLGQSRTIRSQAAGVLTLMTPFSQAPGAGDAFLLHPGCDGTMDAGGCPKFSNLANFRGHPFVPPPSTAS